VLGCLGGEDESVEEVEKRRHIVFGLKLEGFVCVSGVRSMGMMRRKRWVEDQHHNGTRDVSAFDRIDADNGIMRNFMQAAI